MKISNNATIFLERLKSELHIQRDLELASYLGVKHNTISGWKSRNSVDYDLILSKCDNLDWNYLLLGQSNIVSNRDNVSVANEEHFVSIPMLDIPAAAGLPYHIGEARFLQDLPVIYWPGEVFKHGLHIAIQITGDSMEPVLFSGEWVICKMLDDPAKQIRNGNIYIVVTTEGVVAKRLYNTESEKGSITLHSDNPLYQPYQQPLNEVLQVYQAKGKISFNLNAIQNEVKNRLNNLEYKLDQIVSKLS